jgi:hypothetical protein
VNNSVSRADIPKIRRRVNNSASKAAKQLRALVGSGIELLRKIKFDQIGHHPIDRRPLNLIEQVNQTFTALASLRAAELLFEWHPKLKQIRFNIGTERGSDIECPNGTFAAEVFATTNLKNNRKLARDIAKVLTRDDVGERYVFFHCPGIAEGLQEKRGAGLGVPIWAVTI